MVLPKTKEEFNKRIDHTLLKPNAPLKKYVEEYSLAMKYGFRAFVAPLTVMRAISKKDRPSDTRVATVVGFPHGYTDVSIKIAEVEKANVYEVDDVDFVINIINVKSEQWDAVEYEIGSVVDKAKEYSMVTKLILETGYLTQGELAKLVDIAIKNKVDYLKTSTGYGPRGATIDDVLILRELAGSRAKIKASGGIRTTLQALVFMLAGADVIGTSSGRELADGFNEGLLEKVTSYLSTQMTGK